MAGRGQVPIGRVLRGLRPERSPRAELAVTTLIDQEQPDTSWVGIVITSLSLVVMPVLARRKGIVGEQMKSRAGLADAAETWACVYLSAVVLAGLVLNALVGWWWADPLAALGVVGLLVKEGWEALRADDK